MRKLFFVVVLFGILAPGPCSPSPRPPFGTGMGGGGSFHPYHLGGYGGECGGFGGLPDE